MSLNMVRFGLVGLANTTVDYSVFWLLVTMGWRPQAANVASVAAAASFSFLANRHFTFAVLRGTTPLIQQALRHSGVTISAVFLSAGVVYVAGGSLGPLLAKGLAIPLVFIWSYGLSSSWVWSRAQG